MYCFVRFKLASESKSFIAQGAHMSGVTMTFHMPRIGNFVVEGFVTQFTIENFMILLMVVKQGFRIFTNKITKFTNVS